MSEIDWERLQELFHQAQHKQGDELEQFLNQSCGDDIELRTEVQKLLKAANHSSAGFTEQISQTSQQILADHQKGTRIGSYKIVKELGQGGMGSVYLAERADGDFEQQVAIKLISGSLKTDMVAQRFMDERQILARLKHPNIALLLDGGTTESGEPYFAMEYLDGKDIISYCDAQNFNIKQRIKLFIDVCLAVSHAHGQLILHRDIKPSNILVTDSGQPKLLDFGIAKILKPDELNAKVTAQNQIIMTPEYASPEQVSGENMGVASDVYQLGLVLYQLLTGRQAQLISNASVAEIKTAVLDRFPLSPSDQVSGTHKQDKKSSLDIAQNRNTKPIKLLKKLKGDLDTIVLECLHKEPNKRYHSVDALIDDLNAYLELRPIKAKKLSSGYRLNRYIRRHWLGVSASIATLLALATGLTFSLLSLQKTKAAELLAATDAKTANQVSQFLIDMITNADPRSSGGEEISVKDILEESAKRIEQLSDQPKLQIKLFAVIGRAYQGIGENDKSQNFLEQAVRMAEQNSHNDQSLLIDSLFGLSSIYVSQGQVKGALEVAERAFQLAQDAELLTPRMYMQMYSALFDNGAYQRAEKAAQEALLLLGDSSSQEDLLTHIDLLGFLGVNETQQGHFTKAENHLIKALSLTKDKPQFLSNKQAINNYLGRLYTAILRYPEAEKHIKESLELGRKLYGNDHHRVLVTLISLGTLQQKMIKFDEAEIAFIEALEISTASTGRNNPYHIRILQQYSDLKRNQGYYQRALVLLNEALNIANNLLGEEHVIAIATKSYMFKPLNALGRFSQVKQMAAEVQVGFSKYFPDDHGFLLFTQEQLAVALVGLGELNEAMEIAGNVILAKEDRYVFAGLEIIFSIQLMQGNISGIETTLQQYRALLDQTEVGHSSEKEPKYLTMLAQYQATQNEYLQAHNNQQRATELFLKNYPVGHPVAQHYKMHDASYLSQLKQPLEAVKIAEQSFSKWLLYIDSNELETAIMALSYAEVMLDAGYASEVVTLLETHTPTLETVLKENHHQIQKARCLLGRSLIVLDKKSLGNPMVKIAEETLIRQLGVKTPLLTACKSNH
ncbi:tetratricopeptide repeat protein [Marinicella sp. W31]|uniref:protein kinase domain-containing protein n=1 Tax=Marinicella sp. W31 TaxID=3023713 RepID=UPI003756DFD8